MKMTLNKLAFALAISVLAMAFSFSSHARESRILNSFMDKVSGSPVHFSYVMDIRSDKAPIKAEGDVCIEGKCFRMIGNGLENRCDGKKIWTVDENAKEVYIEKADNAENFLLANPLLLISTLLNKMQLVSETTSGDKVTVIMKAAEKMDMDRAVITLSKTGYRLLKAEIIKDGTSIVFDIPSFEYVQESFDPSIFRFRSFSSDWIVTEL